MMQCVLLRTLGWMQCFGQLPRGRGSSRLRSWRSMSALQQGALGMTLRMRHEIVEFLHFNRLLTRVDCVL